MSESQQPIRRRPARRPGPGPRKVAVIFILIGLAVSLVYVAIMALVLSRS
jgi:hypothetical protein